MACWPRSASGGPAGTLRRTGAKARRATSSPRGGRQAPSRSLARRVRDCAASCAAATSTARKPDGGTRSSGPRFASSVMAAFRIGLGERKTPPSVSPAWLARRGMRRGRTGATPAIPGAPRRTARSCTVPPRRARVPDGPGAPQLCQAGKVFARQFRHPAYPVTARRSTSDQPGSFATGQAPPWPWLHPRQAAWPAPARRQ